jgi:hypothetical protein
VNRSPRQNGPRISQHGARVAKRISCAACGRVQVMCPACRCSHADGPDVIRRSGPHHNNGLCAETLCGFCRSRLDRFASRHHHPVRAFPPEPVLGKSHLGRALRAIRAVLLASATAANLAKSSPAAPCHRLSFCRGTNLIQAANSLPDSKTEGSLTVAAIAVAPMTLMPGMLSRQRLVSLERCCT